MSQIVCCTNFAITPHLAVSAELCIPLFLIALKSYFLAQRPPYTNPFLLAGNINETVQRCDAVTL